MTNIILNSVSNLEAISLAVSISVIVLLVIGFGVLFYLYYRYYAKCIDHKVEDSYIAREVILENKKYFLKTEALVNDHQQPVEYKQENVVPFTQHIEKGRKSANIIKMVANIVLIVVYICFVAFMGFAIYVRASGDLFMINDTSCLIIKSGSMEKVDPDNKYLIENNLTNQISTYSLIGINKVEESDIDLYDIIAFKDDNNNIVVHRVIDIYEHEGVKYFTARGDANTSSAGYEIGLTYQDIIGKYNGFQNFGLGIVIYYIQSGIGMITIALALVLIGFYDILDIYLGKKINLRKQYLYTRFENEIEDAIVNENEIHYLDWATRKEKDEQVEQIEQEKDNEVVSIAQDNAVEDNLSEESQSVDTNQNNEETNVEEIKEEQDEDDSLRSHLFTSTGAPRKTKAYDRISFSQRFLELDEELQSRYNAMKQEILSYGVKSRISATGDTFRLHKKAYCKIAISGKNLKLYLALDYKDYENTTYPVKDVGNKGVYADIPVVLKVRSTLSLKRALELIKDCMSKDGLNKKEIPIKDHYQELKEKILSGETQEQEDN